MANNLILLRSDDSTFINCASQFTKTWGGSGLSSPQILSIYENQNARLLTRFQAYADSLRRGNAGVDNIRRRFHGTPMRCKLGINSNTLCSDSSCNLCQVAEHGLQIGRAAHGTFGRGLYFANNSSKSHQYSGKYGAYQYLAVLICYVACGKAAIVQSHSNNYEMMAPPAGFNSVVSPNVPSETVVYKEDAVYPAYIVVYRYICFIFFFSLVCSFIFFFLFHQKCGFLP
jgi:hypothetical protein